MTTDRTLNPQERRKLLKGCLSVAAQLIENHRSELIQAIQQLDCPADRFDLADFAREMAGRLPSVIEDLSNYQLENIALTSPLMRKPWEDNEK